MKIYLDFDDTILDTNGFIQELVRVFNAAGFTEKDFYDNYARTKEKVGDFDIDTLFDFFAHQQQFDMRKTRRSVDNLFSNVDVFVHNDFFDFAKEFGRDKLAILSYGTTPSQREKIENSKIVPYFGEIIVTNKSKEENFRDIVAQHPDKQLFFVEDKADQIDKVKALAPQVVTMKIERPNGRFVHTQSDLTDHVVKDFYDVADIIKKRRELRGE